MNKRLTLIFVAGSVVAAACANGTADDVTEVSPSEVNTGHDAGGTKLPPSSNHDPEAGDDASAEASIDASADAGLDGAIMPDAAKDSAIDSSPPAGACGAGSIQLGEYATWFGKVNLHRVTGGSWLVDDDCTSGANINTVTYCQKFWPTTTRQFQLAAPTSDLKPFTSGGGVAPACGGIAPYAGQAQFACCTP